MSLVTDSEEVLNQKDAEWSSKFVSAAEPSPSSNQSNLPAGKQKTRQQPRKTQIDSSVHKVLIVHLHLRGNEAGLISVKKFFFLLCNSNRKLGLNQSELYFTHRIDLGCFEETWSNASSFQQVLTFVTNYGRFLVSSQTSDSQFVNLIYYAYSALIRKISDKNFSVRRLYHQPNIQTETDISSLNFFCFGIIRRNLFSVNSIPSLMHC